MGDSAYKEIVPGSKQFKSFVAKIVMWFLGRAIIASASLDSYVQREVTTWNDNSIIMLKVNDFGPSVAIRKENGKLILLGVREVENPDLAIYFKNIEAALLVLTGQLGIAQAFAEHRYTLKGDIGFAMSFVRVIYIVEDYLFPPFVTRKILKSTPNKTSSRFKIYKATLFGVR
ncbi:MAG: SCP2 sterol-binding domain-containing protein [Vulcanibacillus sp.]